MAIEPSLLKALVVGGCHEKGEFGQVMTWAFNQDHIVSCRVSGVDAAYDKSRAFMVFFFHLV
jgi:hypothetical protein